MNIPEPTSTTPEYTLNSVPVRINYTGEHHLQYFDTLQEKENEYTAYIRGRKLTGEKVELPQAVVIKKEFDEIKLLGTVKETRWYEREGTQQTMPQKIKELQELAELIHG